MLEHYLGADAAIIDVRGGRRGGNADIRRRAAGQAAFLADTGVTRHSRVAIAHGDGPAYVCDLLAIWSLGATAICLAPSITVAERDNVLARLEPAALIADGALAADTGAIALVAPFVPGSERRDSVASPAAASRDDIALILMTSGTTGQPKGVMLSHRALLARLSLNREHIPAADLAVSLNVLPMHFGHGLVGNTLTPLAAGATLALWPEPGAAGLSRLGETIDRHGVTFMSSVPSLWRTAMRLSEPPSRGTLRRVHVGSAPLSGALWEEIAGWTATRNVFNMYGMSETGNWIAGIALDECPPGDGWAGRPWGGEICVRDDGGRLSPSGRGEVCVASPCLMSGYLDQPEATARALENGWLRTGDIGEIDTEGRLRLVGRIKNEINRGGIKVPAEEIDALLESHPGVIEACAFAIADEWSGEAVAVAVVLANPASADIPALKSWCMENIRREAVPSRIYVLPSIPRNARGKPDRAAATATCAAMENRP